jgi:DNA topoisomerase-1
MQSDSVTDNQLGVCTYLIDKLALRVGNEKGEDEADTVGCCSLRVEHIHIEADNKITLDFLGKDSMRYYNTVDVLPIVHRRLSEFVKGKDPPEDIFDKINASSLNDYLKRSMEDLSAKVFRTYNASITLQQELSKGEIDAEKDSVDAKLKFYNDCNRKVAVLCNHQKSVSKNHDEQMAKINETIDEMKDKLSKCEQLKKLYKAGKEPTGKLKEYAEEKSAPKNEEAA